MSALANQPAFPGVIGSNGYGCSIPHICPNGETMWVEHAPGITLRQFYAGLAMQGLLANSSLADSLRTTDAKAVLDRMAVKSTDYADALIAQLEKAK